MKKVVLLIGVVCATMFVSCETKTCVCYTQSGGTWTKSETLADAAERCSNLSTSSRKCVEEYEADIDPSAIGSDYKR